LKATLINFGITKQPDSDSSRRIFLKFDSAEEEHQNKEQRRNIKIRKIKIHSAEQHHERNIKIISKFILQQ
jgi:hypothetical protein